MYVSLTLWNWVRLKLFALCEVRLRAVSTFYFFCLQTKTNSVKTRLTLLMLTTNFTRNHSMTSDLWSSISTWLVHMVVNHKNQLRLSVCHNWQVSACTWRQKYGRRPQNSHSHTNRWQANFILAHFQPLTNQVCPWVDHHCHLVYRRWLEAVLQNKKSEKTMKNQNFLKYENIWLLCNDECTCCLECFRSLSSSFPLLDM